MSTPTDAGISAASVAAPRSSAGSRQAQPGTRNPNVRAGLNRRIIQVARSNHPELGTVGGLGN